MNKILILGGGGLIGQEIAKRHIADGDTVYIYDARLNPYNDYSNLVGFDLSDMSIERVVGQFEFDIISHQAALVGVGQSQYKIEDYFKNNVQFTAEMLQSMVKFNKFPRKILHAGSMGIYGQGNIGGVTSEDFITHPLSMYGVTKLAQEQMLSVFSACYKVSVISLRYFSVYSTEQNPINPYTGVLSIIANQILNSDRVEMYEDGYQFRDLVHVKDVANAHRLFSRKTVEGFCPVNIATGRSSTLGYIANAMVGILEPRKPVIFNGKKRTGDVRGLVADISKARTFGWKPTIDIEEGIVEYCAFIRDNRSKYTAGNTVNLENLNVESRGLVR